MTVEGMRLFACGAPDVDSEPGFKVYKNLLGKFNIQPQAFTTWVGLGHTRLRTFMLVLILAWYMMVLYDQTALFSGSF